MCVCLAAIAWQKHSSCYSVPPIRESVLYQGKMQLALISPYVSVVCVQVEKLGVLEPEVAAEEAEAEEEEEEEPAPKGASCSRATACCCACLLQGAAAA